MANHSIPSFFKVLSNDFTRQLKLPSYLVLKYEDILPKYVKLRMSNGAIWDVEIGKTEDGKHCLTRGWSEFVKDTKLVEGDYVCFCPDADGFTLDVVVFGANCCEKNMLIYDSDHNRDPCPHFELQLKDWQISRLSLTKKFVEKAGLLEKKQVTLEYVPAKNTLAVALDNRTKSCGNFKFELALGWRNFQKENGLKVERAYSFTFNHARNVIQVQPVQQQSIQVAVVETDSSESYGSDEN